MLLFRPPLLKFGTAGVLPANFATGGDFDSPLLNDADLPDDANTEFLWALLTPLIDATSNGTTDCDDTGFYSHVGADDGTYVQDYRLLAMPPTGTVPAAQDTTYTLTVGSSGLSINATPGTAAASGPAAAVSLALSIAATPGTAAASGASASIVQGAVIDATPGIAAASGQQASVSLALTLSAGPATAAASGAAAEITLGGQIAATPGTAVASGPAATVSRGLAIAAVPATAVASGATAAIGDGAEPEAPTRSTGGRKKRKGNPFLRYQWTVREEEQRVQAAQPPAAAPKPATAASGLLLGLLERAASQAAPAPAATKDPAPAAQELPAAAPAPASAAPEPAAAAPAPPIADAVLLERFAAVEAQMLGRIAGLEAQIGELVHALSLTLPMGTLPNQPGPAAPPAPAAGLAAPAAPTDDDALAMPPRMTPQEIAAENRRRARALARLLMQD